MKVDYIILNFRELHDRRVPFANCVETINSCVLFAMLHLLHNIYVNNTREETLYMIQ